MEEGFHVGTSASQIMLIKNSDSQYGTLSLGTIADWRTGHRRLLMIMPYRN